MRSRLAFRDRVLASAIRVSASRLSSMLAILPLLPDKFPTNASVWCHEGSVWSPKPDTGRNLISGATGDKWCTQKERHPQYGSAVLSVASYVWKLGLLVGFA